MPKNSSAIIGGMGVGISILQSLVEKARRKGLSDEEFHRLATPEGEPVLDRFVEIMAETAQKAVSRIVSSFTIICGGDAKASELVVVGKYDWVDGDITDERFPLKPHALVNRKIEFIEFLDRDPTSEKVLDEFKRHGLKRPATEDALEFGKQYPEEQRKWPIVFLHEPVLDSGGRGVLVLSEDDGERRLRLGWFGTRWRRDCVFAGVRE